jgi:nitrogen fixation protein FixH
MKTRELTGKKVLAIGIAAFAVILAANITMMVAATGTFPGVVVKNSYVASQDWDERARAQAELGWKAEAGLDDEGLAVRLTDSAGEPVPGLAVTATVGRPASKAEDRVVTLVETGGLYAAPVDLAPGLWRIEIVGEDAAGRRFVAEAQVFTKSGTL